MMRQRNPPVSPSRDALGKVDRSNGASSSERSSTCAATRPSACAMMRRACDRFGPSTPANAKISASETSASSSVNPACPPLRPSRRNRDAAGVPVDADFILGLLTRQFQHGAGRCAVRMKANHGKAPGPERIDSENVESDVGWQYDGIAALPDQNPPLAVERHPALAPGHHRAEALAPQQCRGL